MRASATDEALKSPEPDVSVRPLTFPPVVDAPGAFAVGTPPSQAIDTSKWSPKAREWLEEQQRAGKVFKDEEDANVAYVASQHHFPGTPRSPEYPIPHDIRIFGAPEDAQPNSESTERRSTKQKIVGLVEAFSGVGVAVGGSQIERFGLSLIVIFFGLAVDNRSGLEIKHP